MKQMYFSLEINKWCWFFRTKLAACKLAAKIGGKVYKGIDKYLVTEKEA